MNKLTLSLAIIIVNILLMSCSDKNDKNTANYQVIPIPNEIKQEDGKAFLLSKSTKIIIENSNDKMNKNADFLSDFLFLSTGIKPTISKSNDSGKNITLKLGLKSDNPEAYQIIVKEDGIKIIGASEAGVFYGIQTLRKSTPVNKGNIFYPNVIVNDSPRFGYRGIMLDVARHFEPVDFIKKFIDILALHNINKFHWHLTEDQGWRIEIKKYPKLTEIGSKRKETVIGKNTGKYDGIPHAGFYTQEQIKDIVKYAQDRYITIIPEIDLPGHMLAALASYPELGCTGGPYEVEKNWGVFDDVLCAGKESTFKFLEDVLTEVMQLFPSEYIHIGGDESPKKRWETCPRCQARIRKEGLKDDSKHKKEFYLQSYVTKRIEKFINKHGRRIIGWDEILEGELAPNATVMSWRGMAGGIEAAKMNHDVIMSPTTYAYFDYYQTDVREGEPLAIGGYLPLENVYKFEPVPANLSKEERKHILGAQANVWTEYMKTPEHVEYMLVPRIAALCEVQWSIPEKKNYKNFLERLPRLIEIYNSLNINYAKHVFEIAKKMKVNFKTNKLDVELSTIDDAPIYYTTDGSTPTKSSTLYNGVININKSCEIKAIALRGKGSSSNVWTQKIITSKSSFKPTELLTKPDPNYTYSGASMLVDGVYGDNNYRSGKWIGIQNGQLVAIIDLLQPTKLTELSFNSNVVTGDWIFDVYSYKIEASNDNKSFNLVKEEVLGNSLTKHWEGIIPHKITFNETNTRYVKITLNPLAKMPKWHGGAGNKAYLFIDEISLN